MKRKEMEGVIEAILFTMGESVELSRIAKALEEEEETVRNVIHQMMERYEKEAVKTRTIYDEQRTVMVKI